jgi:hypothetical protein
LRYTVTLTEEMEKSLRAAVFALPDKEGAAYLLCGESRTHSEARLLAREVVPVAESHYRVREKYRLSIASDSFVPIGKRAQAEQVSVLFVHSHPEGIVDFSRQDDREDPKLMEYFARRAPGKLHGCLVLSGTASHSGRVWVDGAWQIISRLRVIGRRIQFRDSGGGEEQVPHFFDRQVRAFGPDIQRLLQSLHVGVVGAGGTGSAVIEELTRLGVGNISVFDGDVLSESNVSRVFGSTSRDEGTSKTALQKAHVERIGLGTTVHSIPRPITLEETAKSLRDCDVVFGCTDKAAPRGILVRLALRYLVPVFDMAVKIKADVGLIEGVFGRITTLLPGEACLFCRGPSHRIGYVPSRSALSSGSAKSKRNTLTSLRLTSRR